MIYSRSSRRVWSSSGSRLGRYWPTSRLGTRRSRMMARRRHIRRGNWPLRGSRRRNRFDNRLGNHRDELRGEPDNCHKPRARGEWPMRTAGKKMQIE